MRDILQYSLKELGRPLSVYAELYGRAKKLNVIKKANIAHKLELSVVSAFFIVVVSAFVFRGAEHTLRHAWRTNYAIGPITSSQSEKVSPNTPYLPVSSVLHRGLLRNAILQYIAYGAHKVLGVEDVNAANIHYAAQLVSAPPDITILPGERQIIRLKYTNEGTYNWRRQGRSFVSVYARPNKSKQNIFYDKSWLSSLQAARITDIFVGPGRVGFVEFYVRAPKKVGVYEEKFQLAAENTAWIQGSAVTITVRVVREKADLWGSGALISATSSIIASSTLFAAEMATSTADTIQKQINTSSTPVIRVGLLRVDAPIEFISNSDYELRSEDNVLLGQIVADQIVVLNYSESRAVYTAQSGLGYAESVMPLRLEPHTDATASQFLLKNVKNFLGRDKKINYDKFAGTLEIRFAAGHIWLINELPIETYLCGLAEGGQGVPPEFLKALAIAARAFAYDAALNPTKHPRTNFHVDAEYDQIYKGIVRADANPSWVAAVEETKGQVITYKGVPATAPYFAQSSGRTRAWSEVWHGSKPYLVSVKAPYDIGRKRLGHGVGMSTHDALARAKKGASAEEILRYYYRGIEVVKLW